MRYLIYVRTSISGLHVFEVETDDLYHVVGVLVLESIEHIERIDYNEYTEARALFWVQQGYNITTIHADSLL